MPADKVFLDAKAFAAELRELHANRRGKVIAGRTGRVRRTALTRADRGELLRKTGGRCHICGGTIDRNDWEADHVLAHGTGGAHARTLTGLTSTLNDGAAVWIAPHWPIPAAMAGSRITATRVTPGAICLSTSSHFPLVAYSNQVGVATRPRQAIDEAGADRIGDDREHDRHGTGHL